VIVPTQEGVRRIALSLPQATQSENEFSFRVAGKQFVWLCRERVDPERPKVPNAGVIVVRVGDLGEKQALLASDRRRSLRRSTMTLTTEHDDGCRGVLVRLPKVDAQELTELITDSRRAAAPFGVAKELDGR
jgi:hypothetical protein